MRSSGGVGGVGSGMGWSGGCCASEGQGEFIGFMGSTSIRIGRIAGASVKG